MQKILLVKTLNVSAKFIVEYFCYSYFLQSKPPVKNVKFNYYVLCYSVIKNRDNKEIVNNKYENKEVDYINFNDLILHNDYNGKK